MKWSVPSGRATRLPGLFLACLICASALPMVLSGCGEKIAIPEPVGLWANLAYYEDETYDDPGVRGLVTGRGNVFTMNSNSVTKRNLDYETLYSAGPFSDPTALCLDETGALVFVWDQTSGSVSIFDSRELEPVGSAFLPEVSNVSSMVTSPTGMDSTIVGGRTFLYLSDPVMGLVHRYAVMGADSNFTCSGCLLPTGVLAWPEGDGARSVHVPGGLARDLENNLLVCEKDPERHWVTRFSSKPDSTDLTPIPPDGYPAWAGTAQLFGAQTCFPTAAAEEYVLGNAPGCEQDEWVGGPSSAEGEFDLPTALAIDGEGKIFVADYNNSRIQIFSPQGNYKTEFKVKGDFTNPFCLGLYDQQKGVDQVHYAVFVYVLVDGSDQVIRYESEEHYLDENDELPERDE